jgi:predicted phage terminase large subunit-like protein
VTEKEIYKTVYENDLVEFTKLAFKVLEPEVTYQHNWHVDVIANHLKAVLNGEMSNLNINIPPRTIKSLLVNVIFPCWIWTKRPWFKIISASHSSDLSVGFNMKRRQLIESEIYQYFWPTKFLPDLDTKKKFGNTSGGFMYATSVGGALTGEGAHCLSGKTEIITDKGLLSIEKCHTLFQLTGSLRVLSFNHETNKPEFRRVLATRRTESDHITRTHFTNGRILEATSEHKIFDLEQGYTPIYQCAGRKIQALSYLPENFCKKEGRALQGMFLLGKNFLCRQRLHILWESLQDKTCGLYKKAKIKRKVLFKRMFKNFRKLKVCKEERLYGLWANNGAAKKALPNLHKKQSLQSRRQKKEVQKTLSKLWQFVFYKKLQGFNLFYVLQKRNSLKKNDWPSKSKPQSKQAHTKQKGKPLFFKFKAFGFRKRLGRLLFVQNKRKPARSPYRSRLEKQCFRKLNNLMRKVPHFLPQRKRTKKVESTFQELHNQKTWVYDLQVEKNENFFANGILVHNCLLSDDLINAEDAHSEAKREYANRWYSSTFYNRLQDKKNPKRINIMQRLHENDLTGHINSHYNFENLVIPMQKEKDQVQTSLGWKDPRKEGEFLHPERYADREKEDEYKGLGEYGWAGQMQQRPVPAGGGIIKKDWIKVESVKDISFTRKIISIDATFKGGKNSDYVACQVWGKTKTDFCLIDKIKGKWDFINTVKQIKKLEEKHQTKRIFIEDKANGPAIINVLKQELIGVKGVNPKDSKEARLHSVAHFFETGNVIFDKNLNEIDTLINELLFFPNAKHDDEVDALTQALMELQTSGGFYEVGRPLQSY